MLQKFQFCAGGPVLNFRADVLVHAIQVTGQCRFLEGLLHDAAMELVVGKVPQHQPIGKQLFQDGVPCRPAGKRMLRVLEDKLVGVWAKQGDAPLKQH